MFSSISQVLVLLVITIITTTNIVVKEVGAVPVTRDIFKAVQEDDPIKIEEMITTRGVDINQIGPDGRTPLLYGIWWGKELAVKKLLELNADYTIATSASKASSKNMEAQNQDGYTIFHLAASKGNDRMVEILYGYLPHDKNNPKQLKTGKEMMYHIHDKDGLYPIHRACLGKSGGHSKAVVTFLELGVPHDLMSEPPSDAQDGQTCMEMTPSKITQYALRHHIAEYSEEFIQENHIDDDIGDEF